MMLFKSMPCFISACLMLMLMSMGVAGFSQAGMPDEEASALGVKMAYKTDRIIIKYRQPTAGIVAEKNYGFQNRDKLQEASLGIPYQEYDLEKEEPTGYWRIPVTINGENRALLRLKSTPDSWVFSNFGGAEPAQDMGDQEDKMTCHGKNPRTGRIVRDFYLLI